MRSAGGATRFAALDQRRQNWLLVGLLAAFVVCFLFSDLFTRDATGMPAFWPMNAIVVAGLLHLTPRRGAILWLLAVAASATIHRMAGDSWTLLSIYVTCDGVEALIAAAVARRVVKNGHRVRNMRHAVTLVVSVAPITTAMAAIGAGLSVLFEPQAFLPFFQGWLLCNTLGMIITLPAMLVILSPDNAMDLRRRPPILHLALYGLVALLTATAFWREGLPTPFLIFPAAMLAAFQLGPRGAAISALIAAAIAAPLATTDLSGVQVLGVTEADRIRLIQVFVAVLFFTCLAAALSIRREDRLKHLMARRSASARAARARAQAASQAKTDFLATMSHEIRTPLNSVLGFSELLAATEPLSDEGRRKLDLVEQAGRSLVTIVDDVLDFSRLEAGQVQLDPLPASPAALMRGAVEIIAPAALSKGLAVSVEIDVNETALYALDENRLRQVLLNLLNNAVKFTSQGRVAARLSLEALDDAEHLLIEVSDTGIGVAPEQQNRLFQRFSQADGSIRRSFGGTGLGLAICKALVALMGGEIGLRSAAGQGSTFWVRLPAQRAEAQPVAAAPVAEEGAAARILLVDDHPMNRELGKAMLMLAGCEVETAEDGDEAVRIAAEGRFDLILMDIHMPRMDGVAASVAIRALSCPTALAPIIALSADVMPQQIERCRKAGMVDHIAKPIDRETLYATINRWLSPDPLAA